MSDENGHWVTIDGNHVFIEDKVTSAVRKAAGLPQVMDQEEYLAINNNWRFSADPATNRLPGASDGQKKRIVQQQLDVMNDSAKRRQALIAEYNNLVEAGKIRPPTRIESLIRSAQGHPDNPSVQAARRLLTKKGIAW